MSSVDEMTAAMKGAAKTGIPFVATMSFDAKGRTMMGTTPEAALKSAQEVDPKPVAFGANCGANPRQMIDVILEFKKVVAEDDLIIAKGNCGKPQLGEDGFSYDGTPDVMADYACLVRDIGAHIIGGCCGTTPARLKTIATALKDYTPGNTPDEATIEAALGPIQKSKKRSKRGNPRKNT